MTCLYAAAVFACIGLAPMSVLILVGVGLMLVIYGTFATPAQDVEAPPQSGTVILVEPPHPCPSRLPAGVGEGTSPVVLSSHGAAGEGHNGGSMNTFFQLFTAAVYGWLGGFCGRVVIDGVSRVREWWQYGKLEDQMREREKRRK